MCRQPQHIMSKGNFKRIMRDNKVIAIPVKTKNPAIEDEQGEPKQLYRFRAMGATARLMRQVNSKEGK